MCQTYCVRTWPKYTVERYPKKYIVKSMRIHTNTNTIYQWRCKSWSLRQLVQPHFSWFSCLPMAASAWQAWRSLRVFDTRQVVRSVSHFVYQFVEFVIVLGHGRRTILSSSFLDMERDLFFRTNHLTNLMSQRDFCCESRSDKCVRQCNPPTDCVRRWRWCAHC